MYKFQTNGIVVCIKMKMINDIHKQTSNII